MALTWTAINGPTRDRVFEWADIDNTENPDWVSLPGNTEVTIQLMEVLSGTPTVGVEFSLNEDADASKTWSRAIDAGNPPNLIAMTAADGATVLESGTLTRPRVVTGTGAARVRMKFSPIR